VHDERRFGLKHGDELAIDSTLCMESRAARAPIVIEQASIDPGTTLIKHQSPTDSKAI